MDDTTTAGGPSAEGPSTEGSPAAEGPFAEGPFAECVLCREPTEYPETHKGVTLCPVCEWHEAQRAACSG